MPLFISDEELSRLSNDVVSVAQKADAFIHDLCAQLETVRAEAEAAGVTAESTCALLEQKYVAISAEFSSLKAESDEAKVRLEEKQSEVAKVQAEKHQIHLQSIGKDAEIERLSLEAMELHKSKMQLMELMVHKDSELDEKTASVKGYLEKIVTLTDAAAVRESRISELEAELARSCASSARLSQEKEIIKKHNDWLNEELTVKVNSLLELRKVHSELEADMSSKLADLERQQSEDSSALKWRNDRIRELELKITSLQEELCSVKDAAAATEDRYSAELSTVNKLVELYKESSEEWSKKAGELEGVIKALETHASQLENDYKEKLEKEISARKELEKELEILKEKLVKCEAELESSRHSDHLNLFQMSSLNVKVWEEPVDRNGTGEDNRQLVPSIPAGVSGTALAASLLRDGWSLAKMYTKYQEAVDALRHEQLGRKRAESILERMLNEIEDKAGAILDERAEHDRLLDAYDGVNQKLQDSLSERASMERTIQLLKAELKRHEREYSVAQRESIDLQKQVTVLLKECRDIQLRCGYNDEGLAPPALRISLMNGESDAESVIPERLLTFNDINGLVEQNVKLRSLVRLLSDQVENKEAELKEQFEKELQEHSNQATSSVNAVLARAEEQGRMIESLHTSVAMYKKLFEEEHRRHLSHVSSQETAPEEQRKDIMLLLEGSNEAAKKAQEKANERVKQLEEELTQLKSEIASLRSQRDSLTLQANFAQEKLDRFLKEFDHQRAETNSVIARNAEFSQLIIDYQRKLRESTESLLAAEELSRKLTMEVSVLKCEKELLSNSEKRAIEEVGSLSERFYRLQATLDSIQSAEEVREETRNAEKRKQEEYVKRIEREWAEAKQELQEQRNSVRSVTLDRDNSIKDAMRQIEQLGKDLSNAVRAVTDADSRAAAAEARCADLEKTRSAEFMTSEKDSAAQPSASSTSDLISELRAAKEMIQKLKEEAQINKEHMLQYKSIAEVNEDALKQIEVSHVNFKAEAHKLKLSLEDEILLLKEQVNELQKECNLKTKQAESAAEGQVEAHASLSSQIASLVEECSLKASHITVLESQMLALKDDLEKEHQRWRSAQDNYERQVILQSESIQELTKASQALASLQEEASELRRLVDSLRTENRELRDKWETEKLVLEELKTEAERKYNEINGQNKILHDRLGALHIKLAEKDLSSGGVSSGGSSQESLDDGGLQSVVNHLRRSKEIVETEVSLLKQEKLRLQSQLERALKAEEIARESLRSERANSRGSLFSEEEFKALQVQVREVNLLRESNVQLREESRQNFDECQKLRQSFQNSRIEVENLQNLLSKSEAELETCKKDIEIRMAENARLEKRVDELLKKFRDMDPDVYDRMREDVQQMQVSLRDKDGHLDELQKVVSEREAVISQLEQELGKCKIELNEKELIMSDVNKLEGNLRSEIEKLKRSVSAIRKKYDAALKVKDDLIKEKEALSKELEESKQLRQGIADTVSEDVRKREEKDARLQMLQITVEKLRNEKSKLGDSLEKHSEAWKTILEKIDKLKHGLQVDGAPLAQIFDDIVALCVLARNNFESVPNQVSSRLGAPDTSSADATVKELDSSLAPPLSTQEVPVPKTAEERGKMLATPKATVEPRKPGRKLVRPNMKPEAPQGDVEMLGTDGSNNNDVQAKMKVAAQSSIRKRLMASSVSEGQEESQIQQDGSSSDVVTSSVPKKLKRLESPQDVVSSTHMEVSEISPVVTEEVIGHVGDDVQGLKEETVDTDRDEEIDIGEDHVGEDAKVLGENEVELQNNRSDIGEESLDKPEIVASDDQAKMVEDEQGVMQETTAEPGSDLEEGELFPDVTEAEVGYVSQESVEVLPADHLASSPTPGLVDDEMTMEAQGEVEINCPRVVPGQEDDVKIDEGKVAAEETALEGSDTINNDGNDMGIHVLESNADLGSTTSAVSAVADVGLSKQGGSNLSIPMAPSTAEVKKDDSAGTSSSIINLRQKAMEKSLLRTRAASSTPGISDPVARVLGRAPRGRVARGGRGARGRQSPGPQGT